MAAARVDTKTAAEANSKIAAGVGDVRADRHPCVAFGLVGLICKFVGFVGFRVCVLGLCVGLCVHFAKVLASSLALRSAA